MRRVNYVLAGGIAVLLLVGSCTFNPVKHARNESWYDFAAACLDVFFIYRDRLPSDLNAFSTPQELYESVDERFTMFLTPSQAKERFADLSTQRGGIGIRIDSVAIGYVIEKVYANTPGERAGLRANDTIMRVDDLSLAGLTFEATGIALQGAIGTEVVLRIKRGGNRINIIVVRGTFMLPSVEVDSIDTITASIALSGFFNETVIDGGSAEEFSRALDSTAWARYTLLDLRHNGGGYVDQCIDILGHLVPQETPIVKVQERVYDPERQSGVTVDTVYTTDGAGKAVGRTWYILVDGYTASASEMLVSCMMEQSSENQVTVIGDTTYGKGRGQIMIDGPDSVLAIVTCMTITPVGDSSTAYDSVGIAPDILIDTVDAFEVALDEISDTQAAKCRAGRYFDLPGRRDVDPFVTAPSAIIRKKR